MTVGELQRKLAAFKPDTPITTEDGREIDDLQLWLPTMSLRLLADVIDDDSSTDPLDAATGQSRR